MRAKPLITFLSLFFLTKTLFAFAMDQAIPDNFQSFEEVSAALKESGLESSNLIIAIDFTNLRSGAASNLHNLSNNKLNLYQEIITVIEKVLSPFDEDKIYQFFALDSTSSNICELRVNGVWPHGLGEVFEAYESFVRATPINQSVSFAPAIYKAIDTVKESGYKYHILLIITNGQETNDIYNALSIEAIKESTNYPLSIVFIGVGDGLFNRLQEFDDKVYGQFDNCQFINFSQIISSIYDIPEADLFWLYYNRALSQFAMRTLMEIPTQYKIIKELGLLRQNPNLISEQTVKEK